MFANRLRGGGKSISIRFLLNRRTVTRCCPHANSAGLSADLAGLRQRIRNCRATWKYQPLALPL